MSIIEDGAGTGNKARVNRINQLEVKAVTLSQEQDVSQRDKLAYCGTTGKTALSGVDGVVLFMENHSDKPLVIEALLISAETAGYVMCCQKNDSGTPTGFVAVEQTNINFAGQEESGASSTLSKPSGTSIGGLTDGPLIACFDDLKEGLTVFPINGSFTLEKNTRFTVHIAATGGGVHPGRISWTIRYRFLSGGL